jgi:hypothetical protein
VPIPEEESWLIEPVLAVSAVAKPVMKPSVIEGDLAEGWICSRCLRGFVVVVLGAGR